MVIYRNNTTSKINKNIDEDALSALDEIKIKYDRVSPAIATYKCPRCHMTKAVKSIDFRQMDTMRCENQNCKTKFKIKHVGLGDF